MKRLPNISHELKCVFIHIPKTAGTSIEKKMGFFKPGYTEQDHRTARQFYELYPEEMENYFTFSVIRNPWARVYSWYKAVLKDKQMLAAAGVPLEFSFHDFLFRFIDKWKSMRSQLTWITDEKGNIIVDKLLRFENLEHDFKEVCERLGIQESLLPRDQVPLGSSYKAAYGKEEKEVVAKKYQEEIERFNYTFHS